MNIRCAHCKDRHPSVADVKACAAEQRWQEWEMREIQYAEAGMSWIASGGNSADASAYATGVLRGYY